MSHSFKDHEGRNWTCRVNVDTVGRMRTETDVDPLALDVQSLEKLISDPVQMVELIRISCEAQFAAASVTPEQFGEALYGDAIDNAYAAFLDALADFFPSARRRVFQKAMGRMTEMQNKISDKAMEMLDDPAMEARMLAEFERVKTGLLSGESQASSE